MAPIARNASAVRTSRTMTAIRLRRSSRAARRRNSSNSLGSVTPPRRDGASFCIPVLLKQFRQPGEIERHLARLLYVQQAGVSRVVRAAPTLEHATFLTLHL